MAKDPSDAPCRYLQDCSGITAILFALGVSEAFPADSVWKGAWKFETSHQGQPWLGYHDPKGKTVFLIGCGIHFEVLAVYPATPKQDGRQTPKLRSRAGSPVSSTWVPSLPRMMSGCSTKRTSAIPISTVWCFFSGISRAGSFRLRAATDNLGRGQELRAATGEGAALADAMGENYADALQRENAVAGDGLH